MALRVLQRKFNPVISLLPFKRSEFRKVSSCSCELLKDRSVLTVRRELCLEFLQGLITNDINSLQSDKCIYAMVLNSKGRVLFDSLIYSTESPDNVLIECSSDAAEPLAKHLKMYSLRKEIDVSRSKLSVWAVFGSCEPCDNCVPDPRSSAPWVYRCLSDSQPCSSLEDGKYLKLRYSLGIAEGSKEIPVGEAFPLEYNADFLNGVSFEKGCYIGQELTARVHHTGVVRKRIMPLELSEEFSNNSQLNEPVVDSESGKIVGKVRGFYQNRALALMRVNETLTSRGLVWGQLKARAMIPPWWPPLQKEAAKRI